MAKKKMYEDGNVLIECEEGIRFCDDISVQKTENTNEFKEISVLDAFDAITGYLMPKLNFATRTESVGKCVLCGEKTGNSMRKLCYSCMEKYAEDIYHEARYAIETGKTAIRINVK